MSITMKLQGARELIAQLRGLEEGIGGGAIASVLMAASAPIESEWKRRAPVLTGTYRRSIHPEVSAVRQTGATVIIGTDIVNPPYPFFLEYGTSRMAARPSARPAFDHGVHESMRIIERGLGLRIDNLVKR